MSQITIYIDSNLEAKVKKMAAATGLSISKFISNVLEKDMADTWNSEAMKLEGSWSDFPTLDEIRDAEAKELPREAF